MVFGGVLVAVRADSAHVDSCDTPNDHVSSLVQSNPNVIETLKLEEFSAQPAMEEWVPSSDGKVHVKALVESHCAASQDFFRRQFIPLMKNPDVRKILDIDLEFFTNAVVDLTGAVQCQHGKVECATNRLVMCAKSELSTETFVQFMDCIMPMLDDKDLDATPACLEGGMGLNITRCSSGEKGLKLERDAMASFPEDRAYSPWVLMEDGRSNSLIHSVRGEGSLLDIMCHSASPRPAMCPPSVLDAALFAAPSIRPTARFRGPAVVQAAPAAETAVVALESAASGNDTAAGNGKLGVFFDAMCPASQAFIASQLVPLLQSKEFKGKIDVEILPFANAVVGRSGDLICQHGEFECQANQRILCAKKLLEMQGFVSFMGCVEPMPNSQEAITKAGKCLSEHNVSQAVESCVAGPDARALRLAAFNAAPPDRRYCPWVTVNGEHSEAGERRLMQTVCEMLPASGKPVRCTMI